METVINCTEDDELVRIWTCQPRFLGRLRRNPKFTEVSSGYYGKTAWASFTIPMDAWTVDAGAKPLRKQTEIQKVAASERMKALREARIAEDAA